MSKHIKHCNNEDCSEPSCSTNKNIKNIQEDIECCTHENANHKQEKSRNSQQVIYLFAPSFISFILLLFAIIFDNYLIQWWFSGLIRFFWYIVAYSFVGLPVLLSAFKSIKKGDVFSEFFLMSIATLGAFLIGEYPEGVAVMLFYSIGEIFQMLAVKKAKADIQKMLDQRPEKTSILENNQIKIVKTEDVQIGDVIQLKHGEKLSLDGELLSESSSFNTSALTGESKPNTKIKGEQVLAGMINLNAISYVKVNTKYTDSKLSKILELVQNAVKQKASTELFIRKFAKIYTPIVVLLAVFITFLPYFLMNEYSFNEWLYRALIFLVISCPCALVISIPLGYFGGIGAASRNGILFKGSSFLDLISTAKCVVVDKTGTMTQGVFKVQNIIFKPEFNKDEILYLVNTLEKKSTHPVATAICEYVGDTKPIEPILMEKIEEIQGMGLRAVVGVDCKELLVGNFKLMDKYSITYDIKHSNIVDTIVAVAYNRKFVGYITISDTIRTDAKKMIDALEKMKIKIVMLSGDNDVVVQSIAEKLGISFAFGDMLPEDKATKVKELKKRYTPLIFVGDGVNDALAIAVSDVGLAMGGLGSDATIETADVVIQDDMPSKIPLAINIGKETRKIVWQNIIFAFVVKISIMILGAGGIATMWEAVFSDVGVALLAILNAIRLQNMKFK